MCSIEIVSIVGLFNFNVFLLGSSYKLESWNSRPSVSSRGTYVSTSLSVTVIQTDCVNL